MSAAVGLARDIGVVAACDALAIARTTYYRQNRCLDGLERTCRSGRQAPLALTVEERQRVLDLMHSEPFVDKAPHQIYARLLDRGV